MPAPVVPVRPAVPVRAPTADVQIGFRAPAPSFSGIDELDELPVEQPAAVPVVLAMYGVTDMGVVRTNNEDAFAVLDLTTSALIDVTSAVGGRPVGPRGVLLAVSDGMGGENAGEVASALTLETIQQVFAAGGADSDAASTLASAVQTANVRVAEAASEPGRDGMGATFVAVLIEGSVLYTAEVGDSRAYVLRQGTLTQISKDQTQIQILLDQGLMTRETAKLSRAKNIVLQAIGKTAELTVAQRRLDLKHGDRILLCSDGLTGHLEDAEIGQLLASGVSLEDACTELVAMTNARGGKDNVTVVLAEVFAPTLAPRADDTVEATISTTCAFSIGDPP
jgi:serine/threonine protein phosphatase PrpC